MTDVSWWWSWLIGMIGVAGFFLVGKKIWWAWYVNLGNQFLWTAYSLLSDQYGFLAITIFYFAVFSKNAYEWTFEHFGGFHWRDTLWWKYHVMFHGGSMTSHGAQLKLGERPRWVCGREHEWFPKLSHEALVSAQNTSCVHYEQWSKKKRLVPCPPVCPHQSWPESIFKHTWRGWKLKERLTLPEDPYKDFDIDFNQVAIIEPDPVAELFNRSEVSEISFEDGLVMCYWNEKHVWEPDSRSKSGCGWRTLHTLMPWPTSKIEGN